MPVTAMRSMPTLDVTKLSPAQLARAEEIFEDNARLAVPAGERGVSRQHAEGAGPSRADRHAGPVRGYTGAAGPAQAEVVLGAERPWG